MIIRQDEAQKVIENSLTNQLPYPSLNEINYLAFSEISEEYHNELFGYIEEQGLFQAFVQGQRTVTYNHLQKDKSIKTEQITPTEYIRHQIHHLENTHNARFTDADLIASIEAIRLFIQSQS